MMGNDELPLEHRFIEGDPAAPVYLLLHGTGGGPEDLLPLARELSPDSAVLAPAGAVSEGGNTRWFRRLAEGVFDHEDVELRANELADFVLRAREHYKVADRKLIAAGFSNGANIAAAVALLRPDALRNVIAFAAMAPVPDPPEHDLTGTRVFLSNGQQDTMAPLDSADRLVDMFRDRNAEVATHRHTAGHQITLDALPQVKEWLSA